MVLKSLRNKNLYRGPNSSKEFNQRNEDIIQDMNRLFQQLNENEESIESNMDIVLRENFFLQNHLNQLKQEVEKLNRLVEEQAEKESTLGVASNVYVQNFYSTENLVVPTGAKESYIDQSFGTVSPKPTDVSSKFSYVTDSGKVFLPHGLSVFIKEAKNTEFNEQGELLYYDLVSEETDSIVDRKKDTFWVRNVSFDQTESVTEVYGEVHIKLPVEGLNNLYANALTIRPYPEGSMRIRDIQYKGFGDQWSRLQNYPVEIVDGIETPVVLENSRKLFFQFPRTEATELRILYSQPYWFENEGLSTFAYGFQDIDLQYRIYTEKTCEIVSVLDISDKEALFDSIAYPEAVQAKGTSKDLGQLVEHHLYYDESLETEFDFDNTILAPLSKVYIKTVLKKEGDDIPVLKEIRFPYTFKKQ